MRLAGLSPALIAEYKTQLPDKKLLQRKLHEFYLQNAAPDPGPRNRQESARTKELSVRPLGEYKANM